MLGHIPQSIFQKSIVLYLIILFANYLVFNKYSLNIEWILMGIGEVFLFFYFSRYSYIKTHSFTEKKFIKHIFYISLIVRVIYVIFSYVFYINMTGTPFEFSAGDSLFYDDVSRSGASAISSGGVSAALHLFRTWGIASSDSGYPLFLSIVYFIFDDSIFLSRIIKAILGSYTIVLVFKIAKLNFGLEVAKLSSCFCAFFPNLIFYTGIQLKETEMIFLAVLFLYNAEILLRSNKINIYRLLFILFIGSYLFMFRTVLAAILFLSLGLSIFFLDYSVLNKHNRLALIAVSSLAIILSFGSIFSTEIKKLWAEKDQNQSIALQHYATRKGGNEFAKYAGAAVFAPMIFTIPFPTLVETEGQMNQKMINGGNFCKNITSFFTIMSLFILFFRNKGEWKKHVLILSYIIGYLAVIALSAFAHSERFHLPTIPIALILAAFAICHMNTKDMKLFNYWLLLIFIVNMCWSWFKLAGRGLL